MKLYNVKIFTMDARRTVIERGCIEIRNGLIADVRAGSPENISVGDVDGGGRTVFPGFIDAHTHLGLTTNGVGEESEDFNEESRPCSAALRTIDAVNPFDTSFEKARNAGITSALISPGSMNPVAGDICAFSTDGVCADRMFMKRVGIKFALGENPKMTYMARDESPCTRMAVASVIRNALLKARHYMEQLDGDDPPEPDLDSAALIPLLKGEIKAHFHCHRADDIFTAVRIAREFSLDFTLIHCTDGYLIADELKKCGASAIVGPIITDPCKPEMANVTPANAGILAKSGVLTAICTDHSETPIEYLPLTAGIAIKHGMCFEDALAAVTINAAEIAKTDDITGSLESGKRADIVMFSDDNPFTIEAEPDLVIIGGKIVKNTL